MPHTHRLIPGKLGSLADYPTSGREFHDDREQAEKEFKKLRHELIEWQPKLYAEGKQKLLIVFQAMDAGGKDGTTRKVFRGVNPQGVRVTSFKAPTPLELAHDYLWRVHQQVPAAGMIGVFNRSHYEDVLVVRVDEIVPEAVWQERYEQINQFEQLLASTGTRILKFYLHISKQEQKEQFEERLEDPEKHWKFSHADLDKRAQWDDYMLAYEDALNRCTTQWAPWYVIPADSKWYRNLAVMRVIVDTLREMNPQFPAPEPGLDQVVVE
ncbi:MAG: polyphosphate kinase 2 family protein [Planctomycetaceae bacterium]|nr:polyphosphate kinase 2 family protein [Planctomycetaceae bacterium]